MKSWLGNGHYKWDENPPENGNRILAFCSYHHKWYSVKIDGDKFINIEKKCEDYGYGCDFKETAGAPYYFTQWRLLNKNDC